MVGSFQLFGNHFTLTTKYATTSKCAKEPQNEVNK